MNADGSGLGKLGLPSYEVNFSKNSSHPVWRLIYEKIQDVSPNGEWALMYQGGLDSYLVGRDLTLSLVHLPDGEVSFLTTILPQTAQRARYDSYECGMDYYPDHFYLAVWSPDGQYLAFAAYTDSGTTDLFVLDSGDQTVRRLTNDPAEIEGIKWAPEGEELYYINGNGFDTQWASFASYSLNVTRPGNATNRGVQTLAAGKQKIHIEGFDGEAGVLFSISDNLGCLAGGMPALKGISYFDTATDKAFVIRSGDIFRESLLIDTVNRVAFYTIYDPKASNFTKWLTEIVSFDGKVLTELEGTYISCSQPVYLGDPKYAYLCVNSANDNKMAEISFGGEVDELPGQGDLSVSPDKKWYLAIGDILFLYTRNGTLINAWDVEGAWAYLWDPWGKGLYLTPDGRDLLYYSFLEKKETTLFRCGSEEQCFMPKTLKWIP
jgi:hypothetical protein